MTNSYILSLITWIPAVGAILILAVMKKDQSRLIKRFATAWFAIDFLLSLGLLNPNHRRALSDGS
jgi:NADH:ubiquinone oxidoreductase subunit 4 (subunit M)